MKIKIISHEIDPIFHLVPPIPKLRITLTKQEAATLDRARVIAATVNEQARKLLDDEDRFYDIDDNWVRIEHGCLELYKDAMNGTTHKGIATIFDYPI